MNRGRLGQEGLSGRKRGAIALPRKNDFGRQVRESTSWPPEMLRCKASNGSEGCRQAILGQLAAAVHHAHGVGPETKRTATQALTWA